MNRTELLADLALKFSEVGDYELVEKPSQPLAEGWQLYTVTCHETLGDTGKGHKVNIEVFDFDGPAEVARYYNAEPYPVLSTDTREVEKNLRAWILAGNIANCQGVKRFQYKDLDNWPHWVEAVCWITETGQVYERTFLVYQMENGTVGAIQKGA